MDWNALISQIIGAGTQVIVNGQNQNGGGQGPVYIPVPSGPSNSGIDLSNPVVLIGGLLVVIMVLKK